MNTKEYITYKDYINRQNETYTALASAKEHGKYAIVTLTGTGKRLVGVVTNVNKFMSEVTMQLGPNRRVVTVIHFDQIENVK